MSKSPKNEKLAALKAAGVVPKSARWGKEAESAWDQLSRAFPSGTIPRQATVVKGSRDAVETLRGINMPTVSTKYGSFAIPILPANVRPRIKETKNGVHLVWDNKRNPAIIARRAEGINTPFQRFEILLKKGGNSIDHIRYAARLHKGDKGWSYGRTREHSFTFRGRTINGMRLDTAVQTDDPWTAAADDRYNIDVDMSGTDDDMTYDGKHPVGHDVTALVRVKDVE